MVLTQTTPREERGAVAIVFALVVTALVVLVALVVDLGYAQDTRRVSQNAADSSALAGANALYPTGACTSGGAKPCVADAVSQVKSYALTNFNVAAAAWGSCSASPPLGYDTTVSGTPCIAFDNAASPTKVWVRMPTRNVTTAFAGLIGRQSIAVGSTAEAQIGTDVKCSLCFLGPVTGQNADFQVVGGAIAVNGNVDVGPLSLWNSNSNGVAGTVAGGVFSPPATPIQPFTDPLAGLALPLSPLPTNTYTGATNNTPCDKGPGVYSGPITLGNNVTCDLTPGLYVIDALWKIGNNTMVSCPTCTAGAGVTLYVRALSGELDFKNGNVVLTAPTSGPYAGLGVIYDRNNTNPLSIQGNGVSSLGGTVYAPKSKLSFNGMSCFPFVNGPVVVTGVDFSNGNKACVKITAAVDTVVSRTQMHLSR